MSGGANRMRKIGALLGASRYELLVDENPFRPGTRRHGWWGILVAHNKKPGNIAEVQRLEPLATNTFFYELNGSQKLKLFKECDLSPVPRIDLEALLIQAETLLEQADYFSSSRPDEEIKRVIREVIARRGQAGFRLLLLKAYAGRCMVTGCSAEPALEAAHIVPYAQSGLNDLKNGLLLRADFHTLFDLGLLKIDPELLRVEIASSLLGTDYKVFNGQSLVFSEDTKLRPDRECLRRRYQAWQ